MNGLPKALKRAVARRQSELEREIAGQELQRRGESEARRKEGDRAAAAAIDQDGALQVARMRTLDLLNDREVRGAARQEAYRRALKDPGLRQQALAMRRADIDEAAHSRAQTIREAAARAMGADPKLSLLAAIRQAARSSEHAAPGTELMIWTGDPEVDKARFRFMGYEWDRLNSPERYREGTPALRRYYESKLALERHQQLDRDRQQLDRDRQQLDRDRAQWIKDCAALEMKKNPELAKDTAKSLAAMRLMKRGPDDRLHGASA